MIIKIEDASREQISGFLPDAIAKAITSYHHFADAEVNNKDAKEFAAHHSACKVAIAHIELLLKLARWADLPDRSAGDHNHQTAIAAMMREAEGKLAEYREMCGEENGDEQGEEP
jgi:hypothetical protein